MTSTENNYLFNFSSSYSGGGLKILISYLELFDNNGGATFILNKRLQSKLANRFKNNSIYFVKISPLKRFINDQYYLTPIVRSLPRFDLYFSYGIPIYSKVAKKNWFHVSNLIPVSPRISHLDLLSMLKMMLLRFRIKKSCKNIDILSADSQDALKQSSDFLPCQIQQLQVLKNGLNDSFLKYKTDKKSRHAVTVGTQKYKDLQSLYNLFSVLKKRGEVDQLKIIGPIDTVPNSIKSNSDIIFLGTISENQVLKELSKSSIYLSTSKIENSSIASLEGIHLCSKSYLSKIGSHLEMIEDAGLSYEIDRLDDASEYYKVTDDISNDYIKSISWENVNSHFYQFLKNNI